MKNIRESEVLSVMRWHEGADVGSNYIHNDMHEKYVQLIVAWESLKCGLANEHQQKLCYQINKGLMLGLCGEKKTPLKHVGARIDSLIHPNKHLTDRAPITVTAAISKIVEMDTKPPGSVRKQKSQSIDAVRKQWNGWNKLTDCEKRNTIDKFMETKKFDFE